MSTQPTFADLSDSAPVARREPGVSAQDILAEALRIANEPLLAAHLRVSIATLRRYAAGTLRMNWVVTTRLSTVMAELRAVEADRAPSVTHDRGYALLARRDRMTPHRAQRAVAGLAG